MQLNVISGLPKQKCQGIRMMRIKIYKCNVDQFFFKSEKNNSYEAKASLHTQFSLPNFNLWSTGWI